MSPALPNFIPPLDKSNLLEYVLARSGSTPQLAGSAGSSCRSQAAHRGLLALRLCRTCTKAHIRCGSAGRHWQSCLEYCSAQVLRNLLGTWLTRNSRSREPYDVVPSCAQRACDHCSCCCCEGRSSTCLTQPSSPQPWPWRIWWWQLPKHRLLL